MTTKGECEAAVASQGCNTEAPMRSTRASLRSRKPWGFPVRFAVNRETVNRILGVLGRLADDLIALRQSRDVIQGVKLSADRMRGFGRLPGTFVERRHGPMNPVKPIDPVEAERRDQAIGTIIALMATSLVIGAGIGVTVSALAAVLMGLR